jgi:hypothetical protein
MTKNNTKIIAGIVGAVGIYFILKYYMDKKKTQPQAEDPATPSKPSDAPVLSSGDNFPLKKGSKGAKVIQVQSLLLKIDKKLLPKFGADGDFGSETEGAILKVLGKKTIDSQADIDRLNLIYNRKTFPYVTRNENTTTGFPIYKPF